MFLAIVPHYYMSCFLPKNADHLKKKHQKTKMPQNQVKKNRYNLEKNNRLIITY